MRTPTRRPIPATAGLPDHQSILELHVHAAELAQHVLGPQGMTFLTLDFYQHETQTTPVLEGGWVGACRNDARLPLVMAGGGSIHPGVFGGSFRWRITLGICWWAGQQVCYRCP